MHNHIYEEKFFIKSGLKAQPDARDIAVADREAFGWENERNKSMQYQFKFVIKTLFIFVLLYLIETMNEVCKIFEIF